MKPALPIILMLLTIGCLNKPDTKSTSQPSAQPDLIELNRSYVNKDREIISDYIAGSSLHFSETKTGLWYSMIAQGAGETIKPGDNVIFNYECTLINGDPCYNGSRTLRVGYADAESGVTEGLQMMKQGSDFLFIIPPYLAYGITGDGKKIPGRSILLYRIRIKGIN
jgi:hypothetical protein